MESLLSMIFITGLITAVIKLLIYHYNRLDLYRAGNKIPGPRPVLPIIGNAHLIIGKFESVLNKAMALLDTFKLSPVRFWLGHKFCIILFDPEQFKTVLHSPKSIDKGEMFNFFRPWLGTELFTAPAKKWKIYRKLLMPTFHPKILESYINTMNEQSEILVKMMEPKINGEEFEIFPYLSLCTFDIFYETAMGISVNSQTTRNTTYLDTLNKITNIIFQRIVKIWLHLDIIFNFTKLGRDQKECIKYLHQKTDDVIKQKRQQYSEKINNEDDVMQRTEPKRKAFIDLLMELSNEGTKLTNKELRNHVEGMTFAANDTTSTVDSFVIFMLANFPKIQEKCYEELMEIFGDKINNGRRVENEDLNRMKYLERVIKETMRLFPVAPFLMRRARDDMNVGGYIVPRDSTIFLAILKLHRSADFWNDPLSFNPDRFLPEEVAKRHPYTYIPFSAGPRNCMGLKYAMMSMKILLTTLLRNYTFITDKHVEVKDIEIKDDFIIRPRNPITVRIKRRQNTPA